MHLAAQPPTFIQQRPGLPPQVRPGMTASRRTHAPRLVEAVEHVLRVHNQHCVTVPVPQGHDHCRELAAVDVD
eukprot:1926946-Pyramimonas_sp.AAC.1